MALHLVTGYAGTEHITSADQGAYNMATFSGGEFVFRGRGNQFEATVASNNAISIADGEAMMQGRYIKMTIGTSETVAIDNGTQGMLRHDIIAIRYTKNGTTGIETAELVVVKGTETVSDPVDPELTTGVITDGEDLVNEMALYRVSLDGLNIDSVTQLFLEKDPNTGLILTPIEFTNTCIFQKDSQNYTQGYVQSIESLDNIERKYKLLFIFLGDLAVSSVIPSSWEPMRSIIVDLDTYRISGAESTRYRIYYSEPAINGGGSFTKISFSNPEAGGNNYVDSPLAMLKCYNLTVRQSLIDAFDPRLLELCVDVSVLSTTTKTVPLTDDPRPYKFTFPIRYNAPYPTWRIPFKVYGIAR